MAKEMNAIIKYRPRVILEKTVDKKALADHISQRSAMTKGDVACVIDELVDNMINNLKFARPVKIDGIGTFYPAVKPGDRWLTLLLCATFNSKEMENLWKNIPWKAIEKRVAKLQSRITKATARVAASAHGGRWLMNGLSGVR